MNLLELPKELISEILSNINNYKDYKNLIETSQIFNKLIGGKIFRDKYLYDIILNKFFNKNYNKFKYYLHLLNKKELNNIFLLTLSDIKTVWLNHTQGFGDMRYIFECLYLGCNIENCNIENYNIENFNSSSASHFLIHFYNDLLRCIVYNDRNLTIENINNCRKLKSLHSNFKPYDKYGCSGYNSYN